MEPTGAIVITKMHRSDLNTTVRNEVMNNHDRIIVCNRNHNAKMITGVAGHNVMNRQDQKCHSVISNQVLSNAGRNNGTGNHKPAHKNPNDRIGRNAIMNNHEKGNLRSNVEDGIDRNVLTTSQEWNNKEILTDPVLRNARHHHNEMIIPQETEVATGVKGLDKNVRFVG